RQLDRFESQPIAGTDGAASPFFSADGRWIGFFADEKLKKVAIDGGAPVTVTEARAPRGEDWSDNDAILLTPTNPSPVWRVSPGGCRERCRLPAISARHGDARVSRLCARGRPARGPVR